MLLLYKMVVTTAVMPPSSASSQEPGGRSPTAADRRHVRGQLYMKAAMTDKLTSNNQRWKEYKYVSYSTFRYCLVVVAGVAGIIPNRQELVDRRVCVCVLVSEWCIYRFLAKG